ncbi:MAG TPA: Trp biosynthesis-associated membrane protein [Streptosporangiaceae bacterium]|nr:Trp biosynthesis-associated membrane protein [Streptosporangiaceae bacterium]
MTGSAPVTGPAAVPRPSRPVRPAREFMLALGLAAGGAALVFLSLRQAWAHVRTAAPAPLPTGSVPVSGQALVPVAAALAVVSLAGLVAVAATRGLARRLVGLVLAASGAVTAVLVILPVSAADVLAAGQGTAASQAGSVTAGGGAGPGQAGVPAVTAAHQIVLAGFPWRWLALAGALAVLAAGLAVAWRGARWPVMSSRYDQPGAARQPAVADTAALWESLSKGVDPTEQPGRRGSR